jgi:PhnB protein
MIGSVHIVVSVMLAVADTSRAVAWHERARGHAFRWSSGSVAGMEIAGAPFLGA